MPQLPPDAGPFLAVIADAPDDPAPRLVFADWLVEQGCPGAAAASRWLAAGNRPHCPRPDDATWFTHSPPVLEHWLRIGVTPDGMLPDVPGLTLPDEPVPIQYDEGVRSAWWSFASRGEAERALLEAWPDDCPVPPPGGEPPRPPPARRPWWQFW